MDSEGKGGSSNKKTGELTQVEGPKGIPGAPGAQGKVIEKFLAKYDEDINVLGLLRKTVLYRVLLGGAGLILIIFLVFLVLFYGRAAKEEKRSKIYFQYVYNINQEIQKDKRRSDATTFFAKVVLNYNPKFNEVKLAKLCAFVFEGGEQRYGLPVELLALVVVVESKADPKAKSPKGARGLWQVMPLTGSYIAPLVGVTWKGRSTAEDPIESGKCAVKYLFDLMQLFDGKVEYWITAYNCGPEMVYEWYKKGKKIPSDYREYYKKFLKYKKEIEEDQGIKIFVEGLE